MRNKGNWGTWVPRGQSIGYELGCGPFCAQVLLCKDNSLVGRVNEQVVSLEKEVAVLKQLNHPNIVRYLVSTFFLPIMTAFECAWYVGFPCSTGLDTPVRVIFTIFYNFHSAQLLLNG